MKFFNYQVLVKYRAVLASLHDVLVVCFAWYVAFSLRFNFNIPSVFVDSLWFVFLIAVPIQMLFFIWIGLYKGIWRFASIPDLKRIVLAVLFSSIVISVLLLFSNFIITPRSVLFLNPLLLVLFVGGSRFFYRAWQEHRLYGKMGGKGKAVIVLGAGDTAIALVKDLARSEAWQVVGLLDDDKVIHGRQLLDVKVLGSIKDLPELSNKYQVAHVIIAMPAAAHQARRAAVEVANQCDMTVLTVPAFDDLMSGKVSVSQIRKVEVEDLLGREPVALDDLGLHDLIEGHAVLVSGAGGSIGAELCRQAIKYQPRQLICLDISEYALYQIEQELSNAQLQIEMICITADVKNSKRIALLLARYKPSIVFHAAAYKHVPLMENNNVAEALSNNVLGTYTMANACKQANINKFVLISTDKAVNPTNVMGASKRLAEMVCQGLQEESGTAFVVVRFGNVLGSSGSVIPKFREQIANGGPVTITHPEITRFFMSIPEAAQLVLQAGVMGTGAEIFVLDMGEAVKITDLAQDMIRLSGLQQEDIEIVFTGLRPGEKLYEELLADDEHTLPTPHQKLRVASARSTDIVWVKKLLKWVESIQGSDEQLIKDGLKTWVEEYEIDLNSKVHSSLNPETTTVH